MVTFLKKMGNTALIRLVSCDDSRCLAAIEGMDVCCLDEILNDINGDDSIEHVNLALSYFDDEDKLLAFIKKYNMNHSKKRSSAEDTEHEDETSNSSSDDTPTKSRNIDYKCPRCGSADSALVDKDGRKYPCMSCIEIDVGLRLMDKYGRDYKE